MSDLDFTLCNIPMLLSRSKSEAYQRQIVDRYTSIMSFLWSKKLIKLNPFDDEGRLRLDLVIKKSDVTSECLELFKKAIPAWHSFVDKGGRVEDVSRLERGLVKMH
ncbi:hypothetical protein TZ03_25200 [Pseudomonas sp. 10-1B]|uniref:hypothetical protein n=1 Tax=Pseudomonas sp. 10-1B TaxID=1546029 RepID=UPI00061FE4AE|nr:hypothetical protein [Pseudomonas sp. 10-1B]KIY37961.1 hypothetical protein TZ03_25200 [Pseudomonas sp. 10-1B]